VIPWIGWEHAEKGWQHFFISLRYTRHLHLLDLSDRKRLYSFSDLHRMFRAPVMQSLRCLILSRYDELRDLDLFAELLHLCELHASLRALALSGGTGGRNENGSATDAIRWQRAFPSLTSLHASGANTGRAPGANADAIGRALRCMPHLSHLCFSGLGRHLEDHVVLRCWQLPTIRRIPFITMDAIYLVFTTPKNELDAAATNLHSCHTLTIIDKGGMTNMLPHLRHLPFLRHLILVGRTSIYFFCSSFNSSDFFYSFRVLLQHTLNLHLTLRMCLDSHDMPYFQQEYSAVMREEMQQLQQEFPTRVTYGGEVLEEDDDAASMDACMRALGIRHSTYWNSA